MGRKKEVEGGRVQGYYVQPHHEKAVATYQRRHGCRSASAAVRAILDQVAEAYGVAMPAQGAPNAR